MFMENMKLRLDVNNMMADFIGEKGFTEAELNAVMPKVKEAFNYVQENRGKGMKILPKKGESLIKKTYLCGLESYL